MNRYLISCLIIAVVIIGFWLVSFTGEKVDLIDSKVDTMVKVSPTPEPTNTPPNAPAVFQYDSSTNLEEELDKINPQVLDSDFE